MLTQIDVDSENAFSLPILGATPKAPLLIRTITGLNPPDINLFVGDYSRDGGIYQGRRVGSRNVVLTIDLNPNPALGQTISSLRNDLYKAFIDPQPDADYIKIVLNDDVAAQRYLYGYTEKFETEPFGTDTTVQISVLCPDPYIRDNVKTVVSNPGSGGLVTIPFTYAGSAETGFEAEIFVTASAAAVILDNNVVTDDVENPNYYKGRMIINQSFVAGDVIYVNTTRGARDILKTTTSMLPAAWDSATAYAVGAVVSSAGKYWVALQASTNVTPVEGTYWTEQDITERWANLVRDGATTPLIGYLDPNSRWIELHSQSNTMRVYGADGPTNVIGAIRTLSYVQAYWGV